MVRAAGHNLKKSSLQAPGGNMQRYRNLSVGPVAAALIVRVSSVLVVLKVTSAALGLV